MKKIVLFVLFSILITSCTTNVYLRKAPSEMVLLQLDTVVGKNVDYSFTSAIPEEFKYDNFIFDVNKTYRSNFKVFMTTKYNVTANSDYSIEIELKECSLKAEDVTSGLQSTLNFFSGKAKYQKDNFSITAKRKKAYDWLINTEISLKIVLRKENQFVAEKTIHSFDEYNGETDGGLDKFVIKESFDQAIAKSIIMIDKFLKANEL